MSSAATHDFHRRNAHTTFVGAGHTFIAEFRHAETPHLASTSGNVPVGQHTHEFSRVDQGQRLVEIIVGRKADKPCDVLALKFDKFGVNLHRLGDGHLFQSGRTMNKDDVERVSLEFSQGFLDGLADLFRFGGLDLGDQTHVLTTVLEGLAKNHPEATDIVLKYRDTA